jgi:hypothetical protein
VAVCAVPPPALPNTSALETYCFTVRAAVVAFFAAAQMGIVHCPDDPVDALNAADAGVVPCGRVTSR